MKPSMLLLLGAVGIVGYLLWKRQQDNAATVATAQRAAALLPAASGAPGIVAPAAPTSVWA